MFVTLGYAEGFSGGTVLPDRAHVTAQRVYYVTNLLTGISDPDGAAVALQGVDPSLFGMGGDTLYGLYGNNPWAALDSPSTGAMLDCLSLTAIAVVQLLQAGVDSDELFAYPTTDGDATIQEQRASETESLKYYLNDGVTVNLFEAFAVLNLGSGGSCPTLGDTYTYYPLFGPLCPWTASLTGLPSTTAGQLAFEVMYTELAAEQSSPQNSQSGQQWWMYTSTITQSSASAVPFPVTLP
jgi:hypothetical protein